MRVSNIFELIKKFSNEEDQLSAGFGFILKNNPKLLSQFLSKLGIDLTRKDLMTVDIETQVPHDSAKSRIDLQLSIYSKFLVFLESKLSKSEKTITDTEQLNKYKKILEARRLEHNNKVILVYVSKYPIGKESIDDLRVKLNLPKDEFFFFSWEDLISLTEKENKKETVRLFIKYLGDTMHAKKIISEQKIKDIVEVLVIYTNPDFWKLAQKKNIAVQYNSTPDARYIAFLRTHRGEGKRSAITHIAEVKHTESHIPLKVTFKGFPSLVEHAKQRGKSLEDTRKHYILGKIIPLSKEIPHLIGEGTKAQVNFSTKLSELLRVNSVGEIKTLRKLKEEF